ncbi:hypothetical protein H8356DRAFT_1305554 [Neocallimastix lanati (nom. inval.)]|jgi:hypothetical protein|uniref:C3H1-type domain-containing protein n=1 Tax=Neocallimastix californiae TaxID=1754190 RepID=A0A1Y2F4N3_9FUNG|nr:hypothetical protein H8356DRAFT_1305554 [Neocallimastix sp. JGI-2020a]ORY77895.1 hypothetical protein LY90DRAFT_698426 [Neocallimastix californiae]|eukprot:ORY77895.1 hypothetical protein LY90DRAFT_698426 [Neocallimastix californiae]
MSEFFSKVDEENQATLQQSIKKKLIEDNYQIDPDDDTIAEYIKVLINTDVTKDDVYKELGDVIENFQYSFVDWLYEENEKFANSTLNNDISMGVEENLNNLNDNDNEKITNRKRNIDKANEDDNSKPMIRPISPFEEESQPIKKIKTNDVNVNNNTKKTIRPISPFDEGKKKSKFVTIRNSANDDVDEDEILRRRRLRFQNELPPEKSKHNKNQSKNQNNKNQHNQHNKNQRNGNHTRKESDMRDNSNYNNNNNNKQTEIQIAKIHKRKMNENKSDSSSNKHERHSSHPKEYNNNSGNNEKSFDKQYKNNKNHQETNNNNDNSIHNSNNNSNINTNNDNIDPDQMEEKPVRCVFWPNCTKPDCKFWHPKELCKKFPNCPDNDKCLYIHPQVPTTAAYPKFNPYMVYPSVATIAIPCKYGIHCSKINCPYIHSNQMIMPSGVDPTKIEDTRSLILCHYYPNCLNANCPFYHPPNPAKATSEGNTDSATNNNGTVNVTSAENIVKPIPNFSAVYDITKSKIPCRYEPNCNRPNCPYLHTLNKQINANKHISERGFALDVETEKVLPNNEINKDNSNLSSIDNTITNTDSLQNESNLEVSENADSEIMNNVDDNLNDQVEFESLINEDSQNNIYDESITNNAN